MTYYAFLTVFEVKTLNIWQLVIVLKGLLSHKETKLPFKSCTFFHQKMFVLSKLSSIVRLEPKSFNRPLPDALSEALNAKLANKVVKDVGLVISLYDILHIGESHIMAGDGASHTKVTFRVLVFRPFIEEVLIGKIKSSNKNGLMLNLGFFDDIFVPAEALQQPCRFDESDQVWVWEFPSEDEGHVDLFMDPGEEIRFRVTSESFVDTSPPGPETKKDIKTEENKPRIPYQIQASINEPGLGLLSWWN